jgi:hypothetical protein
MQKLLCSALLVAAAVVASSEARAAGGTSGWGLHSGDTMHNGDLMPYGEFGWPDVSFGVQYGISDKFDLGGRFSLAYSPIYSPNTAVGLGLRMPLRLSLVKGPKFSALLHLDPGFKFGELRRPVLFGLQFPLGAEFGIHVTPEATIQLGFDMPFWVNFTNITFVNIPVLFGFGFEYHVDEHIAVGINTRFGVTVIAGDSYFGYGNSYTDFGFIAQAGFGYRL